MSEVKKPDHFWFAEPAEGGAFGGITYLFTDEKLVKSTKAANGTKFIHVIEHSAYERLKQQNEQLLAAMKDMVIGKARSK